MLSSRPPASRALAAAALGLALALTTAGCSTMQKVTSAAIVDGDQISMDDVSTATTQYNDYVRDPASGSKITQAQMVGQLVLAHFVLGYLDAHGGFVPDQQAATLLAKVPDASGPLKDFIRSAYTLRQGGPLTDRAKTDILASAAKAKVEVNPRYGTFDPATISVAASTPDWIKPGANPEPAPTP